MIAAEFHWIDRTVRMLRWPAAVISAASLPWVLFGWWKLLPQTFSHWLGLLAMIAGGAAYWIFWRPASVRWGFSDVLVQSETRITRWAMRWLTRSPVEPANWLVEVSPYFVPTAAILLAIVAAMIPIPLVPWSSLALGFAISYHFRAVRVVYRTEGWVFHRLGRVWSWLFLPAINLLGFGLLISMALGGTTLTQYFFESMAGLL